MSEPLAPRLKFGKYRDVPLSRIPSDYLYWLLSLDDLWDVQRRAVEDELDHRRRLRLELEVTCAQRQARAEEAMFP